MKRKTKETDIKLTLNIDGKGDAVIKTPLKFLNHMLEAFAKHARFDVKLDAKGDMDVNDHHLVEDIGICFGEALSRCLGDKKGIARMGDAIVPMDDSVAVVAVDFGGRSYANINIPFSEYKERRLGDVSKENISHFLESFAIKGEFNLYVDAVGKNDHHRVEATFKALAKAVKEAVKIEDDVLPSTKGVL